MVDFCAIVDVFNLAIISSALNKNILPKIVILMIPAILLHKPMKPIR